VAEAFNISTKNLNDIIHKVAVDLNIPFIDSQTVLNERYFLPDGLL
jgi:hypothetical protein